MFIQRPGFRGVLQEMEKIQRNMDEFWGSVGSYPFLGNYPMFNVYSKDDEILMIGQIPGIKPEDLEITVKGREVSIKGQFKKEEKADLKAVRKEIREENFQRTFELAYALNENSVKAVLKDGILNITVLRAPEDKPKQISIIAE